MSFFFVADMILTVNHVTSHCKQTVALTQMRLTDIALIMETTHACDSAYLCGFAVVQSEVIAGLEIQSYGTVREMLQVNREHLLWDVVVVQLVIAKGYVHIKCQIISVEILKKV